MNALRFAVLGDPVDHSLSPKMHLAAYRALGLPHVYEKVRAAPGDLPRIVNDLRAGRWAGLNITVPLKTHVLAWVDRVDASAAFVGAANTLVRAPDGSITAHNTDVPALVGELRALAGRAAFGADSYAIVLGNGGAARAAVGALAELGVRTIVVRARRDAAPFARNMSERLGAAGHAQSVMVPEPLAPSAMEARADVVIQATSAGMHDAHSGDGIANSVAWSDLAKTAVALDVVYAPPDTPFVVAARRHGLRATSGLGMLARQGAIAFSLWLAQPAPYDVMRAALHGAS